MEFLLWLKKLLRKILQILLNHKFYGRLLNQIEEDEAVLDYLYEQSVKDGWKDAVDMVLAIEC